MDRLTVTHQGVRPDIPFSDYLRMDCVGHSDLKDFERSPANSRCHWNHQSKSTPAMQFGTAVHMRVLEPATFDANVGHLPADHNGRTKDGKALRAQMETEYVVVLKHEDFLAVNEIRTAVMANPAARTLIEAAGAVESTVTVQDPETGQMCKSRPDKWCRELRTLIDLKKTVRTSTAGFLRQAYELKYFRQLSFYRAHIRWLADAGKIATEPPDIAALLVVTDSQPYENTLIPISEKILAVEEGRWRDLLNRFSDCHQTGVWPGWDPITSPDFAAWIAKDYSL